MRNIPETGKGICAKTADPAVHPLSTNLSATVVKLDPVMEEEVVGIWS